MKFVCQVCGYVYEGDAAPEKCPVDRKSTRLNSSHMA